jgi:hypothetical protein
MRHLKLLLGSLVACLCLAPFAHAEPTDNAKVIAEIKTRLDKQTFVRADFVQTKQMAAMKRPLITSGHLLVSRQDGVLWQIDQPYKVAYVLGKDSIAEIAADGTRRVRTARDVPGLAQVGRVFRALLAADTSSLAEYFDASGKMEKGRWELTLVPRQAQIAKFMKVLRLGGKDFVESVRIEEVSGDLTQIQIRNSRGGGSLNAEEQRMLTGS